MSIVGEDSEEAEMSNIGLRNLKDGDIIESRKTKGFGSEMFMYSGIPNFIPPRELLKGKTLLEVFKSLRDIEMKDDDVIICAYPKCGTHWLWEIIEMLRSGFIEHQQQAKEAYMFEAIFKDGIDAISSPRTLNSHLPLRMLPRQMVEKRVKCFQVFRNPKDVCVSAFNHFRSEVDGYNGNFQEFTEAYLTGELYYGTYYDYIKTWKKEVAERPTLPVLTMFYEDMKDDPIKHVKQVADFLGVKASDKFCTDIAEACSFKNMKKAESKKKENNIVQWREGLQQSFYRKGEKGDWKNWFTVAENEKFDKIWNEKTQDLDIKFDFF